MEDGPSVAPPAAAYVGWEEMVVSNDRGRREVHYFLKDAAGSHELAVVGREKSLRHMTYSPTPMFSRAADVARDSSSPSSPPLRWKSRREVVDWLESIISAAHVHVSVSVDTFSEDDDETYAQDPWSAKDISSRKIAVPFTEFTWLGAAWNCRKRRRHYRSFCRNGITISVHDFVHIMAEDHRRLVAYVEDLYEDSRGNKMVAVRWFDKVDEVRIVLPPDINDREILYSLCLQDLSLECIDGLAAILSAQHFEKFQNERRSSTWEPYLCRWQIDCDDVKPFDITQVQGYWSQELLRSMHATSLKLRVKIPSGGSKVDRDGHVDAHSRQRNIDDLRISGLDRKTDGPFRGRSESSENPIFNVDVPEQATRKQQELLSPGCHIEVLLQDSGIRGCWFHCVVLKRHRDKVKVRYVDVQDADCSGLLEEWILASRIAEQDKLDIRLKGRPMARPHLSKEQRMIGSVAVGSVVDAWWHDGWWEGIVIDKISEEKIHVYFPGEQQVSSFGQADLRISQDWDGNKWNNLQVRPDILRSLVTKLDCKSVAKLNNEVVAVPIPISSTQLMTDSKVKNPDSKDKVDGDFDINCSPSSDKVACSSSISHDVPNLVQECMRLDHLRWHSSKKRRKGRESHRIHLNKKHREGSSSSSEELSTDAEGFLLPNSLAVERENCKGGADPLFSSPVTVSSLVMSR